MILLNCIISILLYSNFIDRTPIICNCTHGNAGHDISGYVEMIDKWKRIQWSKYGVGHTEKVKG